MSARPLPFVSASELRANTPIEPDWVFEGYLAPGGVTLLASKPKTGKSTLAFAISEAVASDEDSFLGRRINGGPVVYCSEEQPATLAHKLAPIDDIRVLTRDATTPRPTWFELVAGAVAEAERIGARLLIIDTLPHWALLEREAEKDAGAMQEAMRVLHFAARGPLAVLVLLHQRKSGGEAGDAIRGSTAIAGAADIVIELERPRRSNQRTLLALSRYPSTPGSLTIERDSATGAWRSIAEGEREDARGSADRQAILSALEREELTRPGLEAATGAPERQWHAQLEALIDERKVERTGAGKKGDPFRFSLVRSDAAQATAQNVRTTQYEGAPVSAAHPVGDAAEAEAPATDTDASCAENKGGGDASRRLTLDQRQALAPEADPEDT